MGEDLTNFRSSSQIEKFIFDHLNHIQVKYSIELTKMNFFIIKQVIHLILYYEYQNFDWEGENAKMKGDINEELGNKMKKQKFIFS
jgi:hypothetical protein